VIRQIAGMSVGQNFRPPSNELALTRRELFVQAAKVASEIGWLVYAEIVCIRS
jgi:hypothetical protein